MQVTTRFVPGDDVFFFDSNIIVERTITKIEIDIALNHFHIPEVSKLYYFEKTVKHDAQLYSSREEIAEAVLNYKI